MLQSPRPTALAENKGGGSWALARIDPASNQVAWTVSLDRVVDFPPGTSNRILTEVEQGEGSVWATMWGLGEKGVRAGFVARLDEQTGAILDIPEVGHSGHLAVGAGAVDRQGGVRTGSDRCPDRDAHADRRARLRALRGE